MFESDDDFMPSSSGNLSSIFNATVMSDNSTLSYKAPKQPKEIGDSSVISPEKKHESKVSTQFQSSVLLAKVITLWKLENGHNKLLGTHIAAIIGNAGQHLYEVIVYQEKTNILIRQPLNEALTLYKYPKNFIGIFDNHKQFWNLSFNSLENQESFLKEVSQHKCQVIEQKSMSNTNDQVDNRIDTLNISKADQGFAEELKTESLVNDRSQIDDKNSRDKILSRITRMGRQILPKGDVERKPSLELSDSETESSYSDQKPQKPTTAPRKFRRNLNQEKALSAPVVTEKSILPSSFTPNANRTFPNNNQMVLSPHGVMYSQAYTDYGANSFILAQNAELKANLTEINMKLNTVLSSQSGNVDKNGNSEECDILKSRIKCLNLKIENLTTDLEKSRQVLNDLKKKYDLKCSEVIKEQEKNARCKNLTEEVNRLREELCNMEAIKVENEQLIMNINEQYQLIESQKLILKEYETSSMNNQHLKEHFANEVGELNSQIEQLTLEIKLYEGKLAEKEKVSSKIEKDGLVEGKGILNKIIKETMNETFGSIMHQFNENEQYNFNEIQRVLLENLKKTTYSLINAVE